MEEELRKWLKPTCKALTDREFNDSKVVALNTDPWTEDAAIAAGWYPQDGGIAGSTQKPVPEPSWLPKKGKAKEPKE